MTRMKGVIPRRADCMRLDVQAPHLFVRDAFTRFVAATLEHRKRRLNTVWT
jgi:hypothetical protein